MKQTPKNIQQFIDIISDKHRMQLLRALKKEGKTYTELREEINVASNTCAYHIAELKKTKLIRQAERVDGSGKPINTKTSTEKKTVYVLNRPVYNALTQALYRFLKQ